jgi:NADP-dependent 3-hydroxy acid dehydrogenase YdfG
MSKGQNAAGCAWITGASSGLGYALARRMAVDGWRVAASARSAEALAELAKDAGNLSGEIQAVPLDVTDPAAVTAAT